MALGQSSRAAAVGASVNNVPLGTVATILPRKTLIIATYDPLITTLTDEEPMLVTSPEDVADKGGAGFMAHRLALKNMLGSNNGPTYWMPQAEVAGNAAAGDITFSGPATANGTVYMYIGGDLVRVTVTSGDAASAIATAAAAAINADTDLPVTAVVNGGVPEQVDITSKSKGPWGDGIALTFNWGFQEAFPAGVSAAVTDMTGGSGIPTIANALNALGTGLDANEDHFTDVVHGYGQDSTTLNALSTYNGSGNTATGLYAKTVSKPFRSLVGDTVAGSSGLSGLVTLADGRKTDRTSGVIAVPGSPNMPDEIAAQAMGVMARLHGNRAEETPIGQELVGVIPGAVADRWTSSYDSLDTAVKGGISPTKVSGGAVLMQNTLTFFRPASIPPASNGYASQRNISIIQNMLYNIRLAFESEKWLGCSIVGDVAKVANIVDRQKARDVGSVLDELIGLAEDFRDFAWVYDVDAYTIPNIQVAVRSLSNGFDTIIPVTLSGELGILDSVVNFDTAISVLL